MSDVKLAVSDDEIIDCFPVMVQLHEKLKEDDFVGHIRRLEQNGYKLARLTDEGKVKSVVGFHLNECIAWEKYLYVADLVTDESSRSRGYGETLIAWIADCAKEYGCDQIHLDSRVIRHATHKFYLNQGFILGGYHFHMILENN